MNRSGPKRFGGSARSRCRRASARPASRAAARAARPAPASRPLLCTWTTSARAMPRRQRAPDSRTRRRSSRARSVRSTSARLRARHPGHGPGSGALPPARGGCATYSTVVAARRRPVAELERQQRVGRLIGRQVRRDVEDPHRGFTGRGVHGSRVEVAVRPVQRRVRTRANVTGTAPSSRVANARKRSSRSQKASSSACGPVVRAAADDGLARVEEQVEHRLAGGRQIPRQRRSCRRATSTTAAATACARGRASRSTRLVV